MPPPIDRYRDTASECAAHYGVRMDEVGTLKAQWNAILDDLESTARIAWLALFDGRIAAVSDGVLTLDFSDANKLAGGHGYERATKPQFLDALADSIQRVTGNRLAVVVSEGLSPGE